MPPGEAGDLVRRAGQSRNVVVGAAVVTSKHAPVHTIAHRERSGSITLDGCTPTSEEVRSAHETGRL